MKILKIFGIVVGIHVFALILIFANPGCSSTTKPPPEPADTVVQSPSPSVTVPNLTPAPSISLPADAPVAAPTAAPATFNPDAPATFTTASASSSSVHFTPTRPNSAAASVITTPPVSDVTPAATYTVKGGDSLWSIAKRNHISAGELAAANSLRSSAVLHEGQKLIIPSKPGSTAAKGSRSPSAAPASMAAASAPASASGAKAADLSTPAPKSSGQELTHTVKEGETLGMIARKYGVKSGDIAVRNNITNPQKLRAGTELVIPGWKSTGKSGGASASSSKLTTPAASAPAESTPSTAPTDTGDQSAPAPSVPVIHLDDTSSASPLTPAPKP